MARSTLVGETLGVPLSLSTPRLTRVVLHLIPLAFSDTAHPLEVQRLEQQRSNLTPLSLAGVRSTTHQFKFRFNLHGYLTYQRLPNLADPFTYVQFYRTGQVEAVDASMLHDGYLHSAEFERIIVEGASRYLAAMRHVGIQPPIIIALSLLGVEGYTMRTTRALATPSGTGPIEEDSLVLPAVAVEDWDRSVGNLLRPVFDSVWNACGWPASPNYGEDGEWRAYPGAYLVD